MYMLFVYLNLCSLYYSSIKRLTELLLMRMNWSALRTNVSQVFASKAIEDFFDIIT